MAAKKRILSHRTGYRFMHDVYDTDPDAITRPDIVPGERRFEDTNPSGVEHRVPRELAAYPGWPQKHDSHDDPTVVDGPLPRASMAPPRASEPRLAKPVTEVPRSGTRHRLVSTVPPPRVKQRSFDPSQRVASQREAAPRVQTPEPPPFARRPRTWPLLVAASLTTAVAMLLGTSLADGSLKRAIDGAFATFSKPEHAAPPAREHPSPVVSKPPAARAPVAPARTSSASAPDAEAVPTVRFEDLPLSKADTDETKTKRKGAGRRRTATPRRP